MKAIIEIKNRHLLAACGILMSSIAENDEQEQSLTEAVEKLKSSSEPIELGIEDVGDSEVSATIGITLASCVIANELK